MLEFIENIGISEFCGKNKNMPKHKIVKQKAVRVDELLDLIGLSLLDDIVVELESDKWVAKLRTVVIFKLILYSLLDSERLSLRVMETNYNSPLFKALEASAIGETAHSSLKDRLIAIDVRFFERVYDQVINVLSRHYDEKQLDGYNIKRYDSTMIKVFSYLLEGMKVGNTSKNKHQVKLTTELQNGFQVKMHFSKDQSDLSEEVALKKLIEQSSHTKNDLIVFDRGIKSRETFVAFKDLCQFTTRLNDNNRHTFVREYQSIDSPNLKVHSSLEFIQDNIVYLHGDGNKIIKEEFRLIQVKRKEDGKMIFFLTNIMDLSADLIAQIYKSRWQIEVLFKFLKQEMNLTHFVSNDLNAIQVMIYMTLIAAMLILVYKKMNNIKSDKIAKIQFFKELEAAVILALTDSQEGILRLRSNLKKYIQRE